MKNTERKRQTLCILAIFLIFYGIVFLTNPIVLHSKIIRIYVLINIPIGTTMQDAVKTVESNIETVSDTHGYYVDSIGSINIYGTGVATVGDAVTVGDKAMQVHLGGYYAIFWGEYTLI